MRVGSILQHGYNSDGLSADISAYHEQKLVHLLKEAENSGKNSDLLKWELKIRGFIWSLRWWAARRSQLEAQLSTA